MTSRRTHTLNLTMKPKQLVEHRKVQGVSCAMCEPFAAKTPKQ